MRAQIALVLQIDDIEAELKKKFELTPESVQDNLTKLKAEPIPSFRFKETSTQVDRLPTILEEDSDWEDEAEITSTEVAEAEITSSEAAAPHPKNVEVEDDMESKYKFFSPNSLNYPSSFRENRSHSNISKLGSR